MPLDQSQVDVERALDSVLEAEPVLRALLGE